jgi:hypothetical protein
MLEIFNPHRSIPFGRKVDIDTSFTFMDPAVFIWSRQYITRRDGVANGGALNELAADALCSKGKNGYLMKLRLKIHTAPFRWVENDGALVLNYFIFK